jgi:uncharacterized protein involved in exopolysaccharide biosynthesis
MKKIDIDILDILIVLAKRKKFILITTFIITVAFIIYSLLATQYWKSSVSFMTISQQQTALPFSGGFLGGLGATFLGQGATGSAQNYINIIRSRNFSEKIINRFDLIEYFEIKDKDPLVIMEKAVLNLNENVLSAGYEIETGMITFTIETKDRYLSRDIAQAYFEMLEEYHLTSKMSKGRERRMFLEQQISAFEENFARLTNQLEAFQTEHRVIDLQAQTEAIVKQYAELAAQRMETEIELEYARRFMAEEAEIVVTLTKKLAVIDNRIKEMEKSGKEVGPKYILDIDKVPGVNNQFIQLNLNIEIQKKVVEFLYPQYEQAKLDELSDISTFEIIDSPVPAGLRSKPRRALIVIIAFALSLIVSSLFAYTYEVFTNTPRKNKLKSFFDELFRR